VRLAVPSVLDELIAALELGGCQPRQVGPGHWLALCPECRASVAEIRSIDGALPVIACTDAHEARLAA
jgi:hypothetical protein